jgi:hypothetical protein
MSSAGQLETNERPLGNESLVHLAQRAAADLKIIMQAEIALARSEITAAVKRASAEAAAVAAGVIVALFGFALLCATAVVGLEAAIEPLWVRMLLMAAVYLVVGGIIAAAFVRRLRRELPPRPTQAEHEMKMTIDRVRQEVQHA